MLKQVVTSLKMVPLVESVNVTFFMRFMNEEGKFKADETLEKNADIMLTELLKWTINLKSIRETQ